MFTVFSLCDCSKIYWIWRYSSWQRFWVEHLRRRMYILFFLISHVKSSTGRKDSLPRLRAVIMCSIHCCNETPFHILFPFMFLSYKLPSTLHLIIFTKFWLYVQKYIKTKLLCSSGNGRGPHLAKTDMVLVPKQRSYLLPCPSWPRKNARWEHWRA